MSTPASRELNDVTLLDLDDLKDYAQRSAERRRAEIGNVREILAAEIDRYRVERAARECRAARHRAARRAARMCAGPSSSGTRAKLADLDADARAVDRRADAGHREQAAARADRPGQGRRRHPRGDSTPTRWARCSTSRVDPTPTSQRPERTAMIRASRRAGAASRAGRPNASGALLGGRRSRYVLVRDNAATPTRRPIRTHRRPGRLRERGAAGRARRPRRRRGALGQGPARP